MRVYSQASHPQLVGFGGVDQVEPALTAVPLVLGGGPPLPLLQSKHPAMMGESRVSEGRKAKMRAAILSKKSRYHPD